MAPKSGSFYSNGLLIFDYQSPTNFKFAGAYEAGDRWVIGNRTSRWRTVRTISESVLPNTDYVVNVSIQNDRTVTLSVDGVPKVTYTFNESLTDGDVGLGTWNAIAWFDDVTVD